MSNRNKFDYTKNFKGNNQDLTDEIVNENNQDLTEENIDENVNKLEQCKRKGKVNIEVNQSLNLRENPSTDSNVIKTLSNDEHVIIENAIWDENNEKFIDQEWYHIVTENGAEGHVMSKFIEIV